MIGRTLRRGNADRPTAVRANRWGRDLDEHVALRQRGSEPAGVAHWSASLVRLSLGRAFPELAGDGVGLALAIGGELGLPLQLELKFQAFDLLFECLVLGDQVRDRFPCGIHLTMELVDGVTALVRHMDQSTQPSAAQMWAMVHLRAGMLRVGIEAEGHGRPSLNDQSLTTSKGLG
jgi:hypothetical protein